MPDPWLIEVAIPFLYSAIDNESLSLADPLRRLSYDSGINYSNTEELAIGGVQ
jgi:hypothetical protein